MSSEVIGSLYLASLAVGTIPGPPALHFLLSAGCLLDFGLCLTILLAPWGFWRAYCGPHCGRESARVLASLLGPSPSGVRHLSRVVPQLGALSESLTHSIPRSLLVVALLTRSSYVLSVPSAFSLRRFRWSISSHCRPSRAVSLLTVSVIGER